MKRKINYFYVHNIVYHSRKATSIKYGMVDSLHIFSGNPAGLGTYPYKNIEPITQAAPTENWRLSVKSKIKMLATQVMMMAREQANPCKKKKVLQKT